MESWRRPIKRQAIEGVNVDPEKIEQTVLLWLNEEKILRKLQEGDGTIFHYIVSWRNWPASIVRSETFRTSVMIAHEVPQNQKDRMLALDPGVLANFVVELKLGIAGHDCGFDMGKDDAGALDKIVIVEDVYDDGLTRDRLMQALRKAHRARMHFMWSIEKLVGELLVPGDQT